MTFLDGQMSVSSKNLMEISETRDFAFSVPVRSRYAILCSPRSGSTLLSRGLYNSQVAGDPLEYLSAHLLGLGRMRYGNPEMGRTEFLRKMEGSRTSLNGVFGMQIHYSQLARVFQSEPKLDNVASFLNRFDRLLWVRRKDKLAQAVSFAIAKRTKIWSSEDIGLSSLDTTDFSLSELSRALHLVISHDLGWQSLLDSLGLNPKVIWYEDLVQNYPAFVHASLLHIGVTPNVLSAASFPIEKQSNGFNLELQGKLASFLGV